MDKMGKVSLYFFPKDVTMKGENDLNLLNQQAATSCMLLHTWFQRSQKVVTQQPYASIELAW